MIRSVTLGLTDPGTPLVLPLAYSKRNVSRLKAFCVKEGVAGSAFIRRGVASSAGRFLDKAGVMLLRRGVAALGFGVVEDLIGTRTGVGVAGSLSSSSSSSSTTIDGALYPGVFKLKFGFMSVKRLQNLVVVIFFQVRRNVFTSRSPLT
jgi:hypothetical protein